MTWPYQGAAANAGWRRQLRIRGLSPSSGVAELGSFAQTVISIRSMTDVRRATQVFGSCRCAGR
jgi:hypothetical protein